MNGMDHIPVEASSRSIPISQLLTFTRQLATMLSSGIPVSRALEILESQSSLPKLTRAIRRTRLAIEDGATIADALLLSPAVFDSTYRSLVSAGERSGTLESSLTVICVTLERSRALRARLVAALIYPSFVILTLIAVTLFLLVWVVPVFEDIFAESSARLPWITTSVITVSRIAIDYGLALAPLTVGAIALIAASPWRLAVWTILRSVLYRAPLSRRFVLAANAARFSRLLASLTHAGVPLLDALAITGETMNDPRATSAVREMRAGILDGTSLSRACGATEIFPPIVPQMIAIGEESGQLDTMLAKTAEFFEQELEAAIDRLKNAIEPCLMIGVGLIVGTLVLAMYLPIFQLGEVAQGIAS